MAPCATVPCKHRRHLRNEWQGERGGDPEAAKFTFVNRKLSRLLLLARTVVRDAAAKTGTADRRQHLGWCDEARLEMDTGALGRQVDRSFDVWQTVQNLVEPRRAGSAGHAFDADFECLPRYRKAGFFDRGDDLLRGRFVRRKSDAGAFCGQIHAGVDTGQTIQHFFDARCASRAGHTGEWQVKGKAMFDFFAH